MSDKLTTLRENREKLAPSLASAEAMFDLADKAVKGSAEAKAENPGWAFAKQSLDSIKDQIVKLDKAIEDEEATSKIAAVINPFIEAFGTVELVDGSNSPPNFHVNDLEKLIKDAVGAKQKAEDRLTLYNRAQEALAAANLPEDVSIERPIHFVVEGRSVTINVASRGGTRAGGTGTRTTGKQVRITGAKNADYIGQTVGTKESTYDSWREFLKVNDGEHFAELEVKRSGGSNYSAAVVAKKRFEIQVEEIESNVNGAEPAEVEVAEPVSA